MLNKLILIGCLSIFGITTLSANPNMPMYIASGKCKSHKKKPFCYNLIEKENKCNPIGKKADQESELATKAMKKGDIATARKHQEKSYKLNQEVDKCWGF